MAASATEGSQRTEEELLAVFIQLAEAQAKLVSHSSEQSRRDAVMMLCTMLRKQVPI